MNSWHFIIIIVAFTPLVCICFMTIRRIHHDEKLMDELWSSHNQISSDKDEDRKKRQDIRQAIHTHQYRGDTGKLGVIRNAVAIAQIGIQMAIVMWLTEQSGELTPQFYIITTLLAASFLLSACLFLQRTDDN